MLEQVCAFYLVLSQAPTHKSKMEAETADTTKYVTKGTLYALHSISNLLLIICIHSFKNWGCTNCSTPWQRLQMKLHCRTKMSEDSRLHLVKLHRQIHIVNRFGSTFFYFTLSSCSWIICKLRITSKIITCAPAWLRVMTESGQTSYKEHQLRES